MRHVLRVCVRPELGLAEEESSGYTPSFGGGGASALTRSAPSNPFTGGGALTGPDGEGPRG